jgi:hypothetical protein
MEHRRDSDSSSSSGTFQKRQEGLTGLEDGK